jgi:hypothetical protein
MNNQKASWSLLRDSGHSLRQFCERNPILAFSGPSPIPLIFVESVDWIMHEDGDPVI